VTLGDALVPGRPNNLHAVRLALAMAVIVSHAWPLALGPGAAEPLEALTGHSLGGWAVGLFFFLSGLLIARSAERQEAGAFLRARARRLLPGLAVAVVVTLVLALMSGGHPSVAEAGQWLVRAVTLVSIEHRIPGAFANAPYPEVVNGPLWSLSHEVAAYGLCWAAVRLGLLRHPAGMAVLGLSALVLWAVPGLPGRVAVFAPLFVAFALGMLAWALRDRVVMSPLVTVGLLVLAPLGWPLAMAAAGHGALVLAFRLPPRPLAQDLSYGAYLYGWPVAQTIVHHAPGLSPVALALASMAAVLPFAWASWHLVERPALFRPVAA
jgi:peptidoglycan/LPS O-acetylase OafA/YrhL